MKAVTIRVQNDSTATVACPVCETSKTLSVALYQNIKHTVRVHCACGTIFLALLEFRRHYRRRINLKGTYRTVHQHHHCSGKMLISDISQGGLKCLVSNYSGLQEGYVLNLDYRLSDIQQSKISRQAVIRHVHGMTVGCEFMEP